MVACALPHTCDVGSNQFASPCDVNKTIMFVFVSLDHLGLNVNNNNSLYVSSLNVCSCFSKVMQDQAENFNKTHIVGEDKSKCRHSLHYYSTP